MVELFANSEDPDQMSHSSASDLSLHCLPITLNKRSPDYRLIGSLIQAFSIHLQNHLLLYNY